MADIPKIVLPHGGYKKLIVYRKSEVIYQGTVVFCRRFLSVSSVLCVPSLSLPLKPQ